MKVVKISVISRILEGRTDKQVDFQGSEIILYDIAMVDTLQMFNKCMTKTCLCLEIE